MALQGRDATDDDVTRKIAEAIEPELQDGESIDDVLAGIGHLAERRTDLLNRALVIDLDYEYLLRFWTWWPFKPRMPQPFEDQLRRIRNRVFQGAAGGDFEELDNVVPNSSLLLDELGLRSLQQRGYIDDMLRVEGEEPD